MPVLITGGGIELRELDAIGDLFLGCCLDPVIDFHYRGLVSASVAIIGR